ncbi:holo-ACP synthase [Gordonia sp. CPCC 205515]|uniref:holo-ACP synthase n=1 Tax=Gordonia sp. CPCC 205515 TaxID=3140791 RepID=UPI003AF4037E
MWPDAGTDIVDVNRIDSLIERSGDRFLNRWFTSDEIAYCRTKAVPSRHFAARFAAKEAVAKVLPSGWDGPLAWRSIEIVNNADGAPRVHLTGLPRELADKARIERISISLSHCDAYATAVAIAVRNEEHDSAS